MTKKGKRASERKMVAGLKYIYFSFNRNMMWALKRAWREGLSKPKLPKLLRRLRSVVFFIAMGVINVVRVARGDINITITPAPPPGVGDKLLMLAGWAVWAIGLASAVVMVYGVFRITQGDRREGTMYLVGGAVGLAVAASINTLVSTITK